MTVDTVEDTTEEETPYIVESLGEFITLLQTWHTKQIRTVEHFMNVPVGQEVEIEGEPSFTLEGESLKGFHLGLTIALHYLGTLPFKPLFEEDNQRVLQK